MVILIWANVATPQIAQQPTKYQINGYLEKTECGHSFNSTAGKKGQINGYLEKAKCGHSTKFTQVKKAK
jgi:hypothetical protein